MPKRPIITLILILITSLIISCNSLKIKDVEKWSQAGKYSAAANGYNELFRKTKRKHQELKAYLAFNAAENYRKANNSSRALNSYRSALNLKYPDSIIYLRVAQQLHQLNKPKSALKYYKTYLNYRPNDLFALNGVHSCEGLVNASQNNTYTITYNKLLSSHKADFSAIYSSDGSTIYFTSNRSKSHDDISDITGMVTHDLYMSKKNSQGIWQKVDSVAGGINTIHDEGILAFDKNGNSYYSYAEQSPEYDQTAKIFKSTKSGEGGWSKGTEVKIWDDSLKVAAHPTINESGTTLYFVSDGGYGGKDLFSMSLSSETNTAPENLGSIINTPGNELFPDAYGDSTLYFASDGHFGLGGLDIFKATKTSDGGWQVEHLPPPINSTANDFGFAINPTPNPEHKLEAIIASSRKSPKGVPSLYTITEPKHVIIIDGFVMDNDGYGIPRASVRIIDKNGTSEQNKVTTRDDGSFKISVSNNNSYLLLASHNDYLNQYIKVPVRVNENETKFILVDFYLSSKRHPEIIRNIFYDFNKADLRSSSIKSLDKLITLLNQNPTESISIDAHTDRMGSSEYNMSLSQKRAESVVAYLVSKGISQDRLRSVGHGEDSPIVVNKRIANQFDFLSEGDVLSETFVEQLNEHQQMICDQLNRRTEFNVITNTHD